MVFGNQSFGQESGSIRKVNVAVAVVIRGEEAGGKMLPERLCGGGRLSEPVNGREGGMK